MANHSGTFTSIICNPKINTSYKIKANKRRMCTIAHEFLQVPQEHRTHNFGSPVK